MEQFNPIFGPDLSQIPPDDLIIVPTDLLAGQIKRDLIKGCIPHDPDHITTLKDFCRYWHGTRGRDTRIVTDGEALSLLSMILAQIRNEVPFFFNQGNPTASTTRDLYSLRSIFSQRGIDHLHHPLVESSDKFRQISHSLTTYAEYLDRNHLLDTPALVEWTISDIAAYPWEHFGRVMIYLVYCPSFREQRLILTIREHAASFRFGYLAGDGSRIFSPPDWLNPKDLVQIQPIPVYPGRSELFSVAQVSAPCDLISSRIFSSNSEEFETIAEEIHTLFDEGTDLNDIAIIFPEVPAVLSDLQSVLDDSGIPFHSQSGEPLIREPLIGFLLLFSALATEGYPREDVISLISSPYFSTIQPGLPPVIISLFDQVVRRAGIEGGGSWEEELNAFKILLEDSDKRDGQIQPSDIDTVLAWITAIQSDCNLFSRADTPGKFAAVYDQVCTRWMQHQYRSGVTESPDPILDREIQAYNLFKGCLKRLISLTGSTRQADLVQFRRTLLYLLEEPVNLSRDRGGVRILGIRQSSGMNYAAVFLSGLVEGDIPKPSTRFPFLTSEESDQLGSRGLGEAIREEQYHFIASLAAGRKVMLSASKIRGERRILSSSFLERVRSVLNPPEWGRENLHSQKKASVMAGKMIREQEEDGHSTDEILPCLPSHQTYGSVASRILVEDWHRTGLPDSPYDGILAGDDATVSWLSGFFGPGRIWSPTRLETYAECPFRFFLEQVVRIQPLPDIDLILSPSRRGTLIHDTLCTFYRKWCSTGPRPVTSQDLPEASGMLAEIARETSGRYRYQSPLWHATSASLLGHQGIPGLYDRYLFHEAEKNSPLRPAWFELEIGSGTGLPDDEPMSVLLDAGEDEPFRIRGRIDRVDITPDGEFAIIDYKTGSSYPTRDHITEGRALQLPLYLLALEQMHAGDKEPIKGIGGSYLEISRKIKQTWPLLNPDKRAVAGLTNRSRATQNYRGVLHGSLIASRNYITGIRTGIFPVTQERCTSGYCPYRGICRYDRFRVNDQEEESSE